MKENKENVTLTYFKKDSNEPNNQVFNTHEDMIKFMRGIFDDNYRDGVRAVYLASYVSYSDVLAKSKRILIESNLTVITNIIEDWKFNTSGNWNLHEYTSFEDAYSVALMMREDEELCSEQD